MRPGRAEAVKTGLYDPYHQDSITIRTRQEIAMKEKKGVTEREVQQAIRKFKEQGGLIRKLPDEVTLGHALVGAKYAIYEYGGDTGVRGENG